MNSHMKRNFNKIGNENKTFVSRIPKFTRNVNVIYSKYSDCPTKIPKSK